MKKRESRSKVLIPARMRIDGAWIDVRIRNISQRGLMVEFRSPPDRGTYIEIAREQLRVAGRIVWSEAGACGVQTRDDINLKALTGRATCEAVSPDMPSKTANARKGRVCERQDCNRSLARMVEFAAIVVCAAGGTAAVSKAAYGQLAPAFETISIKL